MSKELLEAGLKLAKSKVSSSNYGTKYLDRTIYHPVYLTDPSGKTLIDSNGEKIVSNQALYIAGSYISEAEYESALKTEETFKPLNEMFRKDEEAKGRNWKLRKIDQRALQIEGFTNG